MLILDSAKLKHRRVLALSKRGLGWAGTRTPFALSGDVEGLQADIGTESAESRGVFAGYE
jgi:hypothetical protein